MVTSQLTHAITQSPVCKREPCAMLILRTSPSRCSSHIDIFRVSHSLSTIWSIESVLPTTSHVVAPPMRDFNSPSSIARENASIVYKTTSAVCSTICSAVIWLLRFVRCIHSHGNRVINSWQHSSNAMVRSPISCLIILGLSVRHDYVISFSNILTQCQSKWFSSSIVLSPFLVYEI